MLFTANSAVTNYSGQFFYVNNLVLILNILFSSLISSTINYSPLSETILSDNPYDFYMLSLNSLANPFTNILFIVATKCIILNNLSHTTKIMSFSAVKYSSHLIIQDLKGYLGSLELDKFVLSKNTKDRLK